MKKCSKCKEEKELLDFNKKSNNKDGRQNFCRKCDNAQQKERYNKNKQYYIDKSKNQRDRLRHYIDRYKELSGGCSNCTENNVVCLDFHHINGVKFDSIANMVNRAVSFERLKEEIDKCIVLCANCHRKIHG